MRAAINSKAGRSRCRMALLYLDAGTANSFPGSASRLGQRRERLLQLVRDNDRVRLHQVDVVALQRRRDEGGGRADEAQGFAGPAHARGFRGPQVGDESVALALAWVAWSGVGGLFAGALPAVS